MANKYLEKIAEWEKSSAAPLIRYTPANSRGYIRPLSASHELRKRDQKPLKPITYKRMLNNTKINFSGRYFS